MVRRDLVRHVNSLERRARRQFFQVKSNAGLARVPDPNRNGDVIRRVQLEAQPGSYRVVTARSVLGRVADEFEYEALRFIGCVEPTPDPSQEGNCRRASVLLLPS